eukprot:gnl/Dysnectes_brevis/1212_a1355_2454.p1 GENE.gnl/Dysnectes_brevis/1212_a1355_2454~~gnl/Dysnectes_brevis/1212_a1355_2454.p1  ORF type:complete len:415 (+),score=110.01 gnl/Dysnectes_brevis/1212_a1355_2454:20-1264(+)
MFIFGSEEGPDDEGMAVLYDICIALLLVLTAGLCSGLTLGLLSQDDIDLAIIIKVGTPEQKKQAAIIQKLTSNKHRLLVTLLLSNALAMEALPIELDKIFSPTVSIIISVTAVLVFGEVIPQALCKAHALKIGAATAPITSALMTITFPISYPMGKALDKLLPHQDTVWDAARMNQLALISSGKANATPSNIRIGQTGVLPSNPDGDQHHDVDEHQGLTECEAFLVNGVLGAASMTARDVMTPIDDVLTVQDDSDIDQATLDTIRERGYSRIPIKHGSDIIGTVFARDMVGLDAPFPVQTLPMSLELPRVDSMCPLPELVQILRPGFSNLAVVVSGEGFIGIVCFGDLLKVMFTSIDEHSRRRHHKLAPATAAPLNAAAEKWVAATQQTVVLADSDVAIDDSDDFLLTPEVLET